MAYLLRHFQIKIIKSKIDFKFLNTKTNTNKYPHGIDLRNLKSNQKYSIKKHENYKIAIIMLAIPVASFCLGCWQIQRRKWKLELIDVLKSRKNSKPLEIPDDINELKNGDYEYRPFQIRGHFDNTKEILLKTRQDVTGKYTIPGAYVITPFKLLDRDLYILINRGFVPHTKYLNQNWTKTNDEVELIGLMRFNERPNSFTPNNRPFINEWNYRDINSMSEYLNTSPIYLDAIEETTVENGPIGGQTMIDLRNEHLSYVFTWFSLSALTSFMWFKNFSSIFIK